MPPTSRTSSSIQRSGPRASAAPLSLHRPRGRQLSSRLLLAALVISATGFAADNPSFTREHDVIYGRSYGASLTMDVFKPRAPANGIGVILVVSGAYISNLDQINPRIAEVVPFTDRGFTVFGVLHRSQPRYAVPEMLEDLNRSVRYIRHHAKSYGIDPNRLGIYGASSGGHLALMQAMAGDAGKPNARDPIDRVSSRVQAVGVLRPPTDLLNFGGPGIRRYGTNPLARVQSAFDFLEQDSKSKRFSLVTDPAKIDAIGRAVSPIAHVTPDDPPTLIIHGDRDTTVPFQQAEVLVARLREVGVEAKLIPKPGIGHGTFPKQERDIAVIAEWFETHLLKRGGPG